MKQFYIILFTLFFASCSYFGNKEEIEKTKGEAVKELKDTQKVLVEDAKKEIDKLVTEQLGQANESIGEAIKSAVTTISAEVEKKVKQSVKSTLEPIKFEIRIATLLGLVGVALGFIGIVLASIYYVWSRKIFVRGKLHHTVYEDAELENRIKDMVRKTNRSSTGQLLLTRRDVERIVMECLNKTGQVNMVPLNPDIKSAPLPPLSSVEKKIEEAEVVSQRESIELFASNSSTMQLSDIQTTFQRGMSVYKLNLISPDYTTADVTLCVEQADVKQRILVNDSQFLSPICEVRKLTTTPTMVTVKGKGMALKNADGWEVIRKVFVEIK